MKHPYLILLMGLLSFTSKAQFDYRNDTTWYNEQRIAIPNDDFHSTLFSLEDSLSLFNLIHKLNQSRLLSIYAKGDVLTSCCIDIEKAKKEIRETNKNLKFYDLEMNWDAYLFDFLYPMASDIPIIDEYGDPIVITDEKGELHYVYEEDDTVFFSFPFLQEIRIVEQKVQGLNYFTKQPEDQISYEIERIIFASGFSRSTVSPMFSINFKLLILALQDEGYTLEDLDWYQFLKKRQFKGFRYYQETPLDGISREFSDF